MVRRVAADDLRPLAHVAATRRDNTTVVRVDGEIDLSNAEVVRAAILAEVADDPGGLVLDLSGARYLDSAGIRLLFDLGERFTTHRVELRLVVPSDGLVHRVLELTGVMRQMPVHETVAEALGATTPS